MGSLFKAGMGAFKAATGSQQKAQKKAETMRASPADVVCPHTPLSSILYHYSSISISFPSSTLIIAAVSLLSVLCSKQNSHRLQISWSGCKDSQTSADAFEAGAATGAMSHAFITSMGKQRRSS